MIYKVEISTSFTPDDLMQLQLLGCEDRPYFSTELRVLFQAEIVDPEQVNALRRLPCVQRVEPMPIIGYS